MSKISLDAFAPPTSACGAMALPMNALAQRPLHVLHVASGDLWAGAEVQLFHLVIALSRDPATQVTVIVLNPGLLEQRLREAGVAVLVYDERRLRPLRLLTALVAEVKRLHPDIVHTHRLKENVLGSIAAVFAGGRSLRTVHGAEEFAFTSWHLHKRMYRWLDRWCGWFLQQAVVAVSTQLAQQLTRSYPRVRVSAIENGIDIDALERQRLAAARLPGPPDSIRVAFVARLVPVKRVDVFVEIAAQTIAADSRFHFYILGDGPLAGWVRDAIAQRGLAEYVHLLGFKDPLAPYLAKMDMMLITSDHEGLPMNLLEAMALEIPVVARAIGGIPEVLEHGACGTLMHSLEPADYVETMLAYRNAPDTFRAKARRARTRVAQHYSSTVCAERYRHLYRVLHDDAHER